MQLLKQKKINYNLLDDDNKEIFLYEINNHLLMGEKPSEFFENIVDVPLMQKHPFHMLYNLTKAEQSPVHHPEGNVWNHTMLVIDNAAKEKHKSKNQKVFMWAALLHDIGKPDTTKIRKGKITSYDHERVGAVLAHEFLSEFITDELFIKNVTALIRWHMQILHVVKVMPFADIKAMKKETDIHEVALLGYCDRMGRKDPDADKEKQNIDMFIKKCREFEE
ncbi:HDIG domain-containing metalloprotein [Sedimentibacter sp.]|uniref:HDIG domain-containing metalloprotein n=1 Tax=Sedimentibacter sp. TaxID=1960295 RepID=UPI0028B14D44|nr:HDIG domain-containing metalloprotein [Sedimentibacter sp.]